MNNSDSYLEKAKGINEVTSTLKLVECTGYVTEENEKEFKAIGVDLEELKSFECMNAIEENINTFNDNGVIISEKTKENLKTKATIRKVQKLEKTLD